MNIDSIDFNSLIIDRDCSYGEVYSRIVYFSPSSNKYIKKWNKDFYYKKYFEISYKKNFFNEISIIDDVIEDSSGKELLGYVTPKGTPVNFKNLDKNKYLDLIDRVSYNCNKHGIVYLDFVINNIVEYKDKYYLIDLESSIPIEYLDKIIGLNKILEYNDLNYRKQIINLIKPFYHDRICILRQHTDPDKDIKYGAANGRIFLEKDYLPKLSGSVLYVGVNYYTNFYHKLVKNPELFETLDVLEERAYDGSPYKHYLCNILDFKPEYLYDNVVFFGILGHPDDWDILKDESQIIKCMKVLNSCVAPKGKLLLGPATVTVNTEFWDRIYKECFDNYHQLMIKKIDINYIWHGEKNEI